MATFTVCRTGPSIVGPTGPTGPRFDSAGATGPTGPAWYVPGGPGPAGPPGPDYAAVLRAALAILQTHGTPPPGEASKAHNGPLISTATKLAGEFNVGTKPNAKRWELEPGGFKFDDRFYPLVGKPLALLKVFLGSPHARTFAYDDLKKAWQDDDPLQGTIRTTLATLRATLRQVAKDFSISCEDPLPQREGVWRFGLPQ